MLTEAQITAGTNRLVAGKLRDADVDAFVSIFRMFFADLETTYSYDFKGKLEALDDTGNSMQQAAQVAGVLILLQGFKFGVSELDGGKYAVKFKERDRYWAYTSFAFTKLYPLPVEMSNYNWGRHLSNSSRKSQTLRTVRRECP